MRRIELHRHLDISLRLSTLLELAKLRGLVAESTSLESFREKIVLRAPLQNLDAVLATFELFPKVLDRFDVFERVAFEAAEDCVREGTDDVEFRFSPGFMGSASRVSWTEILDGFEAGLKRAALVHSGHRFGLIAIASRDQGPEMAAQTVEFALRHRERLLGLDLAGPENDFPARLFREAFAPAIQAGFPITVHAGESSGPDSIWEAIQDLGARRIGHGIAAIQDPALQDHLRLNGICLEVCPSSNWLTQCVPSLSEHPLPKLLRAGVPVCLNTDDPTVFETQMPGEIRLSQEQMGLTDAEIRQCWQHAENASFFPLQSSTPGAR